MGIYWGLLGMARKKIRGSVEMDKCGDGVNL